MKIAMILGQFSVGSRPLNFQNIWVNSRGLTGTDLATIMIAKELQKLGNEIYLFTFHTDPRNKPSIWENINLFNYEEKDNIIDNNFQAIVSINEPDSLRNLNTNAIKICWEFLNDWSFCKEGFDNFVDIWLSPSKMLMDHLISQGTIANKWKVLPLGCDPTIYKDERIPGRVIWISSADRGLHWLLQEWPKIKQTVPCASLKIFYHFEFGNMPNVEPENNAILIENQPVILPPHIIEIGNRLRYIINTIKKLKSLDVEHIGSVSREQIAKEISQASVFAYSTDTASFSEGFSVSTLENHAGFTVPIVTDVDCLGSVYKESGAIIIKSPVRDHLNEFTDAIIKGLTDKQFADGIIDKCRIFAYKHSWNKIATKLQNIIMEHKK